MYSSTDYIEIREYFRSIADKIRTSELHEWRRYGLGAMYAVQMAVHCNYPKIALVQLGIGRGRGLLNLCRIADFLAQEINIDIRVYGFDDVNGSPRPSDYRDHPELWTEGHSRDDLAALFMRKPRNCEFIIGNLSDAVPAFRDVPGDRRIGFVSVELRHYSAAVSGLKILDYPPSAYLPAVPMFVDNVETLLTHSPWSGEALAISEFNENHEKRKIERKNWRILRFHVCHILDHPIRVGAERPRAPLIIPDLH